MGAFDDINSAAADFSESVMGETFSYAPQDGSPTVTGLTGVFNQDQAQFAFEEFSQRQRVDLVCVTSKAQWAATVYGAIVPENRGTVTYNSVTYTIESVDGANSPGEPCYALGLRVAT